ncbi:MFS transporter [Microbacterium jejuense]|uniref:MFS transporter n=1 Tax=Microbacterium jejuense TaxID=1263637 RepID=A0ABS7HQK0_9MICO|nr:MFS transporter [Microbacterium jejuense]MBW9094985.1 MFS transporter [Microbacterium jejuense]
MPPTDETSITVSADAPTAEAPRRVGGLFLTLFGLMNFGLYLTVMMPALFSLPFKVQQLAPDDKAVTLGLVSAIGAVVSIVSGPVAGVLSDHTRSRWGRRRPWLLGGILVVLAGSIALALAPSVPLMIGAWCIVCIGGAGAAAAIVPVVAERVPEAQRGTVGAIVGVATQLAGVLGYTIGGMLTGNLVLLFALPVLVLGVFALVYSLVFPDSTAPLEHTTVGQTFRLLIFNPRRHPDFSLVWLGKFLMQTALAFLTTYQLYFLADRLGFTAEEAGQKLALVGGIGILVTMGFAVGSGMLSDRLRRRKVFIFTASALTATGLALMAFADGFGLFFAAVMFVLGAAGMFGATDVAMASDLVPEKDQAGRWMTIYNLSATLPGAIAPLIGSGLLLLGDVSGGNYTALFLTGAVIAIGTGVVTSFVRGVR